MKDIEKLEAERESILLALAQLNQSMEVMQQAVKRLSQRVEQANAAATNQSKVAPPYTSRNHPMRRKGDVAKSVIAETPIVLH